MSDTALPDGLMTLLKTGARALVNACAAPGQTGPERVEAMASYSRGEISKWCSENYPSLMPLHVIGILEAATGKPIMTRMLASLTGHQLVPSAAGDPLDLMAEIVRLTGSHARFMTRAAEALEDQKVTPGEAKALLATALRHQEDMGRLVTRLASAAGA